jgi:H/ACA ribonucleoprotein complex subunit 3
MFKCPVCKGYTFDAICPKCGERTENPLPARFSPQDRFGKYRRAAMEQTGGGGQ